jgi:hypothetical protein
MARRRYGKSPAISTAGHAEAPANPAPDEGFQRPIEPLSEHAPQSPAPDTKTEAEPAQHYQSTLAEQIRQQRAYAEQAQLHAYINAIPNLSAAQRQWLAANPHGLYRFDLLHAAHQMALQHGIVPDSDDYFRVLESALHHYGHLPPQQPAQAAPAPAPVSQPMTHIDLGKTEGPDQEPEEMHIRAENVSAPVSRGPTTSMGGEYEPGEGSRVTLSKAEREHAEAAGVSIEEYGRQKLRMLKLKKAKVIRDE